MPEMITASEENTAVTASVDSHSSLSVNVLGGNSTSSGLMLPEPPTSSCERQHHHSIKPAFMESSSIQSLIIDAARGLSVPVTLHQTAATVGQSLSLSLADTAQSGGSLSSPTVGLPTVSSTALDLANHVTATLAADSQTSGQVDLGSVVSTTSTSLL